MEIKLIIFDNIFSENIFFESLWFIFFFFWRILCYRNKIISFGDCIVNINFYGVVLYDFKKINYFFLVLEIELWELVLENVLGYI